MTLKMGVKVASKEIFFHQSVKKFRWYLKNNYFSRQLVFKNIIFLSIIAPKNTLL